MFIPSWRMSFFAIDVSFLRANFRVAPNQANAVANLPIGGLRCDVFCVSEKEKA